MSTTTKTPTLTEIADAIDQFRPHILEYYERPTLATDLRAVRDEIAADLDYLIRCARMLPDDPGNDDGAHIHADLLMPRARIKPEEA